MNAKRRGFAQILSSLLLSSIWLIIWDARAFSALGTYTARLLTTRNGSRLNPGMGLKRSERLSWAVVAKIEGDLAHFGFGHGAAGAEGIGVEGHGN